MRIVLQRVSQAHVTVSGKRVGETGQGMVILLGIGRPDQERDADYLADKVTNLRIFADESGKMNCSILDVRGGVLVVSQFTLYGDCRKGRRPGFDDAAPPETARRLYEYFVKRIEDTGLTVATGIFQASMEVTLTNDGPVTFILDSKTLK